MLRISKISFPGLGIGEFSVESVAFTVFGADIAWYAILITLGMVLAVLYTTYRAKQINIAFDDVLDFTLWAVPIGIIGARLYYILTKLEDFPTFKDWINIRGGGLAIYGGLIGGALAVLLCCYVKKINFFAIADCCIPGIILAQGIGRWGNFMNGEAFGYETDWFCRMGLNNALTNYEWQYVHPTFLYESLWNILGFVLAHFLFRRKKYDGEIFFFVTGWYGLGRMLIEGLRTDSLYIPGTGLRISQVLAGVLFVACAALMVYFGLRKTNKPLFRYEKTKKQSKTSD